MTVREGLTRARSHIIFLIGLIAAFGLIIFLETVEIEAAAVRASADEVVSATPDALTPLGGGRFTPVDRLHAEIAWQYFSTNTQPETGLVNSVTQFPSTTMWDQASYLLALIAAHRLDVITTAEFDSRVTQALQSLAALPLVDDKLPNKAYDTRTLQMTDYANRPSELGIGWSALDIARITVPLNVLVWSYPEYVPLVRDVVKNWDFDAMLQGGRMMGTRRDPEDGPLEYVQEGRIGYEEYGARAMGLLGYDVNEAARIDDFSSLHVVEGVEIVADRRTFRTHGAHNYVLSEPYVLTGLEFGLTDVAAELSYRVYAAQEARYEATGVLTAVSEDHVDEAPYFVYNTVFSNGKSWNAITEEGEDASEHRTLSIKASFGWNALYGTPYTEKLVSFVSDLHDPTAGWYSGWYEEMERANRVLAANANGIVLEALHYKAFGPMVSFDGAALAHRSAPLPRRRPVPGGESADPLDTNEASSQGETQ